MTELKTHPTNKSVKDFIDGIADDTRRRDCRTIMRIMKKVTKARPKMWGGNIVGYGKYHFKYASGREGEWFAAGLSPRVQSLTLYIMSGFRQYASLMKKLGKRTTGKLCLYIKRLDDIDLGVLAELIERSVRHVERSRA
ncbi:MAG TPA: DUF1801 domain-containing protein [Gemmatimonadales bacterium]|nr:DUF1801 domain-containing protein [Gemmatimonadales bacterium]